MNHLVHSGGENIQPLHRFLESGIERACYKVRRCCDGIVCSPILFRSRGFKQLIPAFGIESRD